MKRLLIIKAASDVCPTEIAHIVATCKIFKMEVDVLNVENENELRNGLGSGTKYDYIYLCAHANHQVFGDNDEEGFNLSWSDFSGIMCESGCMNYGCIFLLACCRTGLTQVAYDLFCSCAKVEFVCGPRWTLNPNDLTIAFDVFIYNMEERKEQPDEAAKRMSLATGYTFSCYDRVEVEMRPDYREWEKQQWEYVTTNYKVPDEEIEARQEKPD
ncbi:hypothetical protein [Chryseolinea sp. H1M3-3]|uniref:hypothetical protein n=1 Tax=Chryseolinea sp. H1M3-3 TaxID=3034144 RepID=UPI0023ED04EB|nr:hypothetical protein [Chryseolinea sp. H1M3-3]